MNKRYFAGLLAFAVVITLAVSYPVSRLISGRAVAHADSYVVGTWNLEDFREGAKRGFPENTHGGPTYPARTETDYQAIAGMIRRIKARILVLEEINAYRVNEDGRSVERSRELDHLVRELGEKNYGYVVGRSGGAQHIAILYDKRRVRLNQTCECTFDQTVKVQGKDVFDREPLMAHFTFLDQGRPMNDLLVVGVHWASGQRLTQNHDYAMRHLIAEIERDRQEGHCLPRDENDVLIAGDFNANRFDRRIERFWSELEANGWDVLGDNAAAYPVTRLSGVPLGLRKSKIDYIIVTRGHHGLAGEEVVAESPVAHRELIGDSPETYRRRASDHLPVTVAVRVMRDTDQ